VRNTLVADTGVVYAALDRDDANHESCAGLLGSGVTVVLPASVPVELDWLARTRGTPEASLLLLRSILEEDVLVVDLDGEDYERSLFLMIQYADLRLSLVDASVIAIAERLEQDTLATLDHRHFSVVRPLHIDAFTLVP
jgi:predicted nucleic acid-binding protein